MGGLGSGNRYRFDKKTTTDECRSLDVRRFHREGLLKSGTSFSWRWSRAGRRVASTGALVYQDKLVLSYRSKLGGEWEDVDGIWDIPDKPKLELWHALLTLSRGVLLPFVR